jgi:hypothetical protein
MRKLSLFLALALVLAFVGGAIAQTVVISIDNISNMYTDGLRAGATHVVSLRYDARNAAPPGDPPAFWAGSNEFEIYSPQGAQWTTMTGAYGPLTNQLASTVNKYRKHNFFDGTTWNPVPTSAGNGPVGASTGPLCRASFWLTIADFNGLDGWEGGADNDIAITLTFSTLLSDGTLTGDKTMCIDTSIANVAWEWGNPTQDFPVWDNNLGLAGVQDGPRCLKIYTVPNQVPVWNPYVPAGSGGIPPAINPTTYSFERCVAGAFDLSAFDPDQQTVTYVFVPGFEHGAINGNHWTWAVPDALGGHTVKFLATDGIGNSVELETVVTVTNDAPTITCPTDVVPVQVTMCAEQTVVVGDACDILTFSLPGDPAGTTFEKVDNTHYKVKFCPTEAGDFTTTVQVSDGDKTATCDLHWSASFGADYQVLIAKIREAFQGQFVVVPIYLYKALRGLGGFDLLIAYDASALAFQRADTGHIYAECGWEYFTYRFGAYGNCGSACPSGMLRIIGMAETNNGPNHPTACGTDYVGNVPVSLAKLRFLVSNDRSLECSYVPIRFFWYECGDNTLSDPNGDTLYVSQNVYDFYDYEWIPDPDHPEDSIRHQDQFTDIGYSKITGDGLQDFPTYQGAPNECICTLYDPLRQIGDPTCKETAIRAIAFQNGGIDIACADSIDARGDINLNGLAYEIADAVMFTNYFIKGVAAFGDNPTHQQGSIAASDTNADGLALTVADLVYLIRVVIGDAQPYDKAIPVTANVIYGDGNFSVDVPMGAAHIVIAGEVTPTLLATNMEMKYGVVDGNTNIIIFSLEANQSFSGQFLNAEGRVISANLATFLGQPVSATMMPADFALEQNYPNPFNPTTTIKIAIPKAGIEWNLNIYNVTGQLVQTMSGMSTGYDEVVWDASNNASGIYFYKLTAGDFSATKKAVLLK